VTTSQNFHQNPVIIKIPKHKEDKIMAVIKINKENFASEVLNSEKTVLLDFYADWCGPCKMVAPIVEEISNARNDVKVGKINVDEQPELAAQFGIASIPMLAVMKNGKLVNSAVGARPKAQIEAML
jgi:thioredoxin 1